jgi:hypothetical protein
MSGTTKENDNILSKIVCFSIEIRNVHVPNRSVTAWANLPDIVTQKTTRTFITMKINSITTLDLIPNGRSFLGESLWLLFSVKASSLITEIWNES